jgi:Rrf2 family protein
MQLTRAADYAVRVMIHLAAAPPGVRMSRESLAEAAEIPAHFSGKVLQALTKAQLITSWRGAQGGFTLARAADAITMLEVVEALEGPLMLNACLSGADLCGRSWWCGAHLVWREAQEALGAVLRRATIADLAARSFALRESREGNPLWS